MRVNGVELDQENWLETQAELTRKAVFDLECDEPAIVLTVLDEERENAVDVGARGCGRRVRYVRAVVDPRAFAASRRYSPWVANVAGGNSE